MIEILVRVQHDFPPSLIEAIRDAARALAPMLTAPVGSVDVPAALAEPVPAARTAPAPSVPTAPPREPEAGPATAASSFLAAPPVAPAAPPAPAHTEVWTPERLAVLNRDWATDRAMRAIITEVAELPGAALTPKQIENRAYNLGLRRKPAVPPAPAAPSGIVEQFRAAAAEAKAAPVAGFEPVEADLLTIRGWAAQRGLAPFGEPLDLGRINRKRVELGLAPFRHSPHASTRGGA